MNKDLHDIDQLFYEVLEGRSEAPSLSVKEKLIAALDKRDAESNRRRFIWWRTTALLLVALLAAYVLVDGNMLKAKNKPGNANAANPVSSPVNNSYQKETALQQQADEIADPSNNPEAISRETINQFSNPLFSSKGSPDKLLPLGTENRFYTSVSHAEKKSTGFGEQRRIFSSIPALPESYREGSDYEMSKQLPFPLSLAGRSSKNISLLQHRPLIFVPTIISEKSPGKIFRPYWEFTVFTSYDQAGYQLDSDDYNALTNIRHTEVHEPSFSGGILVKRQFSRHWGLQTGLTYSYTAIGISPQKIYAFQDPSGDIAYKYITSSGYAYIKPAFGPPPAFGDSLVAESKHTLQTVHIPVVATYRLGKNNSKFSVIPGAGLEAGIVTGARTEVELTDASNHEKAIINKLSGTKKVYLSATAAVEFKYKLNKKISITLQPVFRHAISPITENNVVETFPRSFGIRAGLTFKL